MLDIIEDRNDVLWLGTWGGIAQSGGKIVPCRRPDGLIGYNDFPYARTGKDAFGLRREAASVDRPAFEAVTNLGREMPEAPRDRYARPRRDNVVRDGRRRFVLVA